MLLRTYHYNHPELISDLYLLEVRRKKKSKATDLGMTDRKEFAVEDIKPAIIHSPYALDEGKI